MQSCTIKTHKIPPPPNNAEYAQVYMQILPLYLMIGKERKHCTVQPAVWISLYPCLVTCYYSHNILNKIY